MENAKRHGIPVTATKAKPYSTDRNQFHVSYEGGILEDPWEEAPEEIFQMTVAPDKAPAKPVYLEIEYEQCNPAAVNGNRLSPAALLSHVNEVGAAHGAGRVDSV